MRGGLRKFAVWVRPGFVVAVLLAVISAATAADYPRRIAVAPFTILGPPEKIQQTVDILPRLVSSRLMALAGAEVLLLPPGDTPPEDAAKGAGLPLLLKGSVAKLGAGYSIDVAVTDLATGQVAGAFFVVAGNEDEIIPRLGDLAVEISEKMFGMKGLAKASPPPPAPAPQIPPPVAVPPAAAAVAKPAVSPPAPAMSSPTVVAPSPVSEEAWVPSSMEKEAESGKIADELHGVVAGDADAGGNGEIIAYGKKGIHLYRVSGTEILPKGRVTEGLPDHILNLEAIDLDGDGEKEIVVTGIDGETLRSQVLKKSGETYGVIADRLPYYLVLLPDWKGKEVLAGQQKGDETPFHGKFYAMLWDGKILRMGEALPADTLRAPFTSGILGLSSARFGEEWKWVYTDGYDNLRILSARGDSEYKTAEDYGWSGDSFEWGLYLPRQGKTKYYVRKAVRVARGPDGKPLVLAPKAEQGLVSLEFSSKTTRLVLIRWDGGEFIEAAGTPKGDRAYSDADFLSPSGLGKGGRAVASVIEQPDGVIKGGISRLVLFRFQ